MADESECVGWNGWVWKPWRNGDFVRGLSEFLRIQLRDLCDCEVSRFPGAYLGWKGARWPNGRPRLPAEGT